MARRPRSSLLASGVLGAAWTVAAVPVGYLGVLTVAAWSTTLARRRAGAQPEGTQPDGRAADGISFALLIPAHDEEAVIADTLAALAASEPGPRRTTVHVVADHCTDRTVELAMAAGVDVLRHDHAPAGKGPALGWAIEQVLAAEDPPDAVVVIDADTVVSPPFLREVGRAMAGGARVVQGQYRVRDAEASTSAGLRTCALALRHHLRPLGRRAIGGSCGLFGNGMAFRTELLRDRPWSNHLTEDLELQVDLLLEGIEVDYAPEAVVEAAMPSTLEASASQNARWERGRIELARRYVPPLARRALTTRGRERRAALDAVLDLLVPPMSVVVALVGAVAVLDTAASVARGRRPRWRVLALPAVLGFHVASGLALARIPLAVLRSLLHVPAMIVWKLRLWFEVLRKGDGMPWVRTART